MTSPNSTVQILLVEDDQVDVRAIQRGFRSHGIEADLTVAKDGFEALDHLRGENGKPRLPRPYLILLDLKMPRMGGIEFLETLRSDPELKTSVVFVLTTSDDDNDILSAYENFVAGYLLKSDVGENFTNMIEMFRGYISSVHFPPESS